MQGSPGSTSVPNTVPHLASGSRVKAAACRASSASPVRGTVRLLLTPNQAHGTPPQPTGTLPQRGILMTPAKSLQGD